ncbi:hypothetical protein [Paenibacillus periandrae]|uniref:hypothetical protein n=1 Tax=Paenibacillus periandrae TaxID=1761741 RepID=UPI001F09D28F|nr:hypothetical protein [Paenibacillus periandrae]
MYYHGTSLENLHMMLQTGLINILPKKKVWPDHSGPYIYFFNEMVDPYAKELAAEQAAYALLAMHHTRRAIIAIEPKSLNTEKIEVDPDMREAVRFSDSIPLEVVYSFFIEEYRSKDVTQKWLELAAISKLVQLYPMYESGFYYADPDARKDLMQQSGIHYLDLIAKPIWSKGSKLLDRLEDLQDESRELDRFQEHSFEQLKLVFTD